jgi:hypothetical protein
MAYQAGDRVVITRGLLAGVEATVLRPARLGHSLVELDAAAPRWAAIRRARAADWALAPAEGPASPSPTQLARRRRVAFVDLTAALVLLPLLLLVGNVVPALAAVLAVGAVTGLAALHASG